MKPVARKGKFAEWLEPNNLIRLQGWARDGLTDEQMAENMGIGLSTFYEWKNKFPEIAEALKDGKDVADRNVENALYKSALGYETTEESWEEDPKTGEKKNVKKTIKKVQPNVTAQIFWLKNRKRKAWRDRIDNTITGEDGGAVKVGTLTDAAVDARIKELEKKLNHK